MQGIGAVLDGQGGPDSISDSPSSGSLPPGGVPGGGGGGSLSLPLSRTACAWSDKSLHCTYSRMHLWSPGWLIPPTPVCKAWSWCCWSPDLHGQIAGNLIRRGLRALPFLPPGICLCKAHGMASAQPYIWLKNHRVSVPGQPNTRFLRRKT